MQYDVVVIGAGPGGKSTAMHLEKEGKRVCLIEKDANHIGGTCLNEGCIPTKLFLESVSFLDKKAYLERCGLNVASVSFEMPTLLAQKEMLLNQLRTGAMASVKKTSIDMIFGTASFVNEDAVQVNNQIIEADSFAIATGSTYRKHPLLKIDHQQILCSDDVFGLETIPKSIVIVGGGAIGCEFATFFHALGSRVHIVEFTSHLVPAEDADVASALKRELERKGIKISLSTNVTAYEKKENSVALTLKTSRGDVTEEAALVLVSIGRIPNIADLQLEKAKVTTERGFVHVDEYLQTSNPNIYALGDVVPTPALAHVAYDEAKVVAHNLCHERQKTPSSVIPFVTFCQPQVASVGWHERELKEENIEFDVIKSFFKSSAKAKINGDDSGFIKLLCDKENGLILGGSIVGHDATELIHEVLVAINKKATKEDLKDMVFAHPTLSESLWSMLQ
ncbi:dihydrolipoyl dehydrogenase [Sulfurospirillum sp. 1612]|uniref:dihydrolipoyl dehydrogenase n=1 Tax=Sulfurospirillum sp. 1612 TaxID=3094835 RepID=UPI002F951B9E